MKSDIGYKDTEYPCKENDNFIKLIFNDGELDELHFTDCLKRSWTVIGRKDFEAALELAKAVQSNKEYNYAKYLATYLWKTHYKNDAPEWEPLNTLVGVLTQIDNMIAELIKPTSGKEKENHEV